MAGTLSHPTLPPQVTLIDAPGSLPKLRIETPWSTAEVYFQGAHVTAFQKKDEPPLLFLSEESQFISGKAIRGGIPLIFPWFGNREGFAAHGFARNTDWNLKSAEAQADGSVVLVFTLSETLSPLRVSYQITISETLALEFKVQNPTSETENVDACLHTYFSIGDIAETAIAGLRSVAYIDQLDGNQVKSETADALRISEEVDRIYTDVPQVLEILDEAQNRKISLVTENSHSAVVWNPWIEKSRRLGDFGDEEYHRMVCVESGNVAKNRWKLAPNSEASLKLTLESSPFG